MRLWGGRFGEENDARVADFTRSIEVDRELALDDLAGSVAHVRGLGRAGLLTDDEVDELVGGLTALAGTSRRARIEWDPALEDVHMNLEAALAERIGPVAGKLHTGRSRNDQVATDLRLWLRRAIDRLDAAHPRLGAGARRAGRAGRRGDPARDRPTSSRPSRCSSPITCSRTSRCSSATAAGWPTRGGARTSARSARARWPAPATRSTARRRRAELGFDGVTANSLDAVSDRDFVVEALAAAALGMVHLSRLAEEITWWSNPRVRVRPRGRRVLDRQLDDAEQAEPRSGRARPRPGGARDRRADGGPGAAQGPAARVPARPPGGQAAAVRGGRRVGGVARRDGRDCSTR